MACRNPTIAYLPEALSSTAKTTHNLQVYAPAWKRAVIKITFHREPGVSALLLRASLPHGHTRIPGMNFLLEVAPRLS